MERRPGVPLAQRSCSSSLHIFIFHSEATLAGQGGHLLSNPQNSCKNFCSVQHPTLALKKPKKGKQKL
jgi:hypothetical protein